MSSQDSGASLERSSTERSNRSKLVSWLERFFLMRAAFGRASERLFKPTDPGYAEYLCARQCLDGALRLEPEAAVTVECVATLRGGLHLGLEAWRRRAGLESERDLSSLFDAYLQHDDGSELKERLTSNERELLTDLVSAPGVLHLASLDEEKRSALRAQLQQLVERIVNKLDEEARALDRLKAVRMYRLVVLPVATVMLLGIGGWYLTRPVNYALNSVVQLSSSFRPDVYPAAGLVNGDKDTLAIHTTAEANPWAMIDLGATHSIHRVVVENRKDVGGRSIPLQIETSPDGVQFHPYALRETEFTTWIAKGPSTRARYVRLTLKQPMATLELSEVEVY